MEKQALFDCANAINIIRVRLTNENKECKLHELEKLIKRNTLYEIELMYTNYTNYTHDEFMIILDNFLIPDLSSIILKYLTDIRKIIIIRKEIHPLIDIYFIAYDVVYNYYGQSEKNIGIIKCTSKDKYLEAMNNTILPHKYTTYTNCKYCKTILRRYTAALQLYEDNLEELSLMYKIAQCLLKS